jgi:hypothetical protein
MAGNRAGLVVVFGAEGRFSIFESSTPVIPVKLSSNPQPKAVLFNMDK